jgi:membrane protease YdiL (CAAX protease family)
VFLATNLFVGIAVPLLGVGPGAVTSVPVFVSGIALLALIYALTVWLFVVRPGVLTWAEMGWPTWRRGVGSSLRAVVEAVGVIVPVAFLALILAALVVQIVGTPPPDVLPEPGDQGEVLLIVLAAALIAPVGEELFFRGFALTAWQRDLGPRTALTRSAVFFALVHIVNIQAVSLGVGARQALIQFVVILPVGLALGWLFQRGGMVAAIAGHVTYNGLLLVLAELARQVTPLPA